MVEASETEVLSERAGASEAYPTVVLGACPSCGARYAEGLKFCPFDGETLAILEDSERPPDPLLGCVIEDRYRIEGVLAEGGMGTVYRVSHTTLSNPFAMKVLRREFASDPTVASRLVAEAKATAAIDHHAIVEVTDFGEIDAQILPELGAVTLPYFVMEYVEGHSLGMILRQQGRLSIETIFDMMSTLAGALGAAHAAGIVHRDLKPENLRIEPSGAVRVLDFGVAKVLGASRQTQKGMVFGTPHYMSPEQAQGHPIDGRTDIYALGVLMYQCATGKIPFEADTYMGVVTQHMFEMPQPFAVVASDLAGHPLEGIVMCCLEKDPAARFQTMDDMKAALEAARTALLAGEQPLPSSRVGGRPMRLRSARRVSPRITRTLQQPRRVTGAMVVVIFVVLGVLGGGLVWGLRHARWATSETREATTPSASRGVGQQVEAAKVAGAPSEMAPPMASATDDAAAAPSASVAHGAEPPRSHADNQPGASAVVRSKPTVLRQPRRRAPEPRPPKSPPPSPPPPQRGELVDPW
ncbi:MAG: serine/threonine-protein kinase [Polyangiaceae bacterium]